MVWGKPMGWGIVLGLLLLNLLLPMVGIILPNIFQILIIIITVYQAYRTFMNKGKEERWGKRRLRFVSAAFITMLFLFILSVLPPHFLDNLLMWWVL